MDTISEQVNGFPPHLVWAVSRVETTSDKLNAHLVAVIVKGGNVITWSRNIPKMNVYTMQNAPKHAGCVSIHAEVSAIFRARRKTDLRGCKMFVARVTKDNHLKPERGRIGLAKPCAACMRAIASYGIKRVIYTIEPNAFGTLNVTDFAPRHRNKGAKKLPHS